MRIDLARSRIEARRPERLLALDGVSRALWKRVAKQRDVAMIDARTALPFAPLLLRGVVAEPGVTPKREGVGAKDAAGEVLFDILAHAGHDGHDSDEEHHPDHHPEQCEEALQLL